MTDAKLAQAVSRAREAKSIPFGDPGVNADAIATLADRRDEAIKQRDRALALLREPASFQATDYCAGVEEDDAFMATDPLFLKCNDDPMCWEHRRRALLSEVDQ